MRWTFFKGTRVIKAVKSGGTDRLKQLQKNWLIILALDKGVVAEEPLKDKAGIEKDFLFIFLKRARSPWMMRKRIACGKQ